MNIFKKTPILISVFFLSSAIQQVYAESNKGDLIIVNSRDLGNWDKPISLDLKKIKNVNQIDVSINEYIKQNYPGYRVEGRIFTMNEDRYILILSLKNNENNKESLYLDMTDIYKKLGKSNKFKNEIKFMESEHKPK